MKIDIRNGIAYEFGGNNYFCSTFSNYKNECNSNTIFEREAIGHES